MHGLMEAEPNPPGSMTSLLLPDWVDTDYAQERLRTMKMYRKNILTKFTVFVDRGEAELSRHAIIMKEENNSRARCILRAIDVAARSFNLPLNKPEPWTV